MFLEASLSVFVGGVRKSILNGSFFSLGFDLFAAPSVFASARGTISFAVRDEAENAYDGE